MIRVVNHRWLSLILIMLAAASLGLVACQASTETKQGGLGEFCNNRDSDCREGLICESGECVSANPAATDGCQGICDKIESCGLTEPNCVFDCQDEINDWGDGVIDVFSACVIDDLTCDELGSSADDAAQTCYDRLELDDQRVDRCRDFEGEIESCRPERSTSDFQSDCIYFARTTGEDWDNTDECVDAIEFGAECSETMECINTVFSLPEDEQF
ncbi:MAG: hypothetical protein ACOC9W_04210 [Persicimonas sp.]